MLYIDMASTLFWAGKGEGGLGFLIRGSDTKQTTTHHLADEQPDVQSSIDNLFHHRQHNVVMNISLNAFAF